ncbi:MAG: DUF4386 family protein [Pseudomonadota bacterium]
MKMTMKRKAGLAMTAFVVAANVPFAMLVETFGYDDVLREPPLEVLAAFNAGGPQLILIWLAFAVVALSFLLVSAWTGEAVKDAGGRWPQWAAAAGAASAVAQAVGLSRWVFVAPVLADQALSGDPATSAAAIVFYQGLHQFAGVGIGEWLGQTLLAAWTLGFGLTLLKGGAWSKVLGGIGLILTPLWIVGHAELLASVDPGFPDLQIAQWVFSGWLAWLLAVGLTWSLGRTTKSG